MLYYNHLFAQLHVGEDEAKRYNCKTELEQEVICLKGECCD